LADVSKNRVAAREAIDPIAVVATSTILCGSLLQRSRSAGSTALPLPDSGFPASSIFP